MHGKELAHFGCRAEMVVAVQALVGMVLAQERQGADALDDIIFPAVGRQFVMDGKRGNARQERGPFFEGLEAVDFQVKTAGEKPSQFAGGTDGEKPLGVEQVESMCAPSERPRLASELQIIR